ncbi:hypothetical protein A2U01_0096852, partial [Trifolium medium]|nr:hypothetical protein [Trifolium medium]
TGIKEVEKQGNRIGKGDMGRIRGGERDVGIGE